MNNCTLAQLHTCAVANLQTCRRCRPAHIRTCTHAHLFLCPHSTVLVSTHAMCVCGTCFTCQKNAHLGNSHHIVSFATVQTHVTHSSQKLHTLTLILQIHITLRNLATIPSDSKAQHSTAQHSTAQHSASDTITSKHITPHRRRTSLAMHVSHTSQNRKRSRYRNRHTRTQHMTGHKPRGSEVF